jgi:hypothetical protein
MTADDLSAPLGSSRQAGDAASRSRSIARSAASEVARAGAAFAGRQHFSNQGWGYV